ncbi:hypothetical protein DPMN_097643 [Dreissena polymorpha]|uniref:Uncharacterized protein n=1 Tax=Dreissena polymorpha TaxID=45954 RepID=A0A9D4LAV9_DREPO|nr:hypothetical protein DPMN_097643 [Dreissena polymorpha]
MNSRTKFNEDWTINVAPRVKNVPSPATETIFELIQDIIGTNLLTKFQEDRKINVASRVKIAPPPGSHVFEPTRIIFELVQDTIRMNLLTRFHEDWTINGKCPPLGSHVLQANVTNLLTKFS